MMIRFQNNSGKLENVVKFLESVQKKVNYINLTAEVEDNIIKISLFGTRDLQILARERLEYLARQYL